MKNVGRHTVEYVENNRKNNFTFGADDAIIASIICLDNAYLFAKNKKDIPALLTVADKWLDVYQLLGSDTKPENTKIGFI